MYCSAPSRRPASCSPMEMSRGQAQGEEEQDEAPMTRRRRRIARIIIRDALLAIFIAATVVALANLLMGYWTAP